MRWVKRVGVAAALFVVMTGPASAQVVFNELLIRPNDFQTDQAIELKNTSSTAVDLGGWFILHLGTYSIVPQGTSIAAGGLLVLHFNAGGINTASDIYFPGDQLATISDLSLYGPNTLSPTAYGFTNPDNSRSFVQWGGAPQNGKQSVAEQAGLWTSGTYLPGPAAGPSFELCSGFGTFPTNYVDQASPTIGSTNLCQVQVEAATWSRLKSIFQ